MTWHAVLTASAYVEQALTAASVVGLAVLLALAAFGRAAAADPVDRWEEWLTPAREAGLLLLLLAAAVLLRTVGITRPLTAPWYFPETTPAFVAEVLNKGTVWQRWLELLHTYQVNWPWESAVMFPVSVAFQVLFGPSLHLVPLVGAFFGVSAVLLAWTLGRVAHSKIFGLLFAAFMAVSPLQVVWSRLGGIQIAGESREPGTAGSLSVVRRRTPGEQPVRRARWRRRLGDPLHLLRCPRGDPARARRPARRPARGPQAGRANRGDARGLRPHARRDLRPCAPGEPEGHALASVPGLHRQPGRAEPTRLRDPECPGDMGRANQGLQVVLPHRSRRHRLRSTAAHVGHAVRRALPPARGSARPDRHAPCRVGLAPGVVVAGARGGRRRAGRAEPHGSATRARLRRRLVRARGHRARDDPPLATLSDSPEPRDGGGGGHLPRGARDLVVCHGARPERHPARGPEGDPIRRVGLGGREDVPALHPGRARVAGGHAQRRRRSRRHGSHPRGPGMPGRAPALWRPRRYGCGPTARFPGLLRHHGEPTSRFNGVILPGPAHGLRLLHRGATPQDRPDRGRLALRIPDAVGAVAGGPSGGGGRRAQRVRYAAQPDARHPRADAVVAFRRGGGRAARSWARRRGGPAPVSGAAPCLDDEGPVPSAAPGAGSGRRCRPARLARRDLGRGAIPGLDTRHRPSDGNLRRAGTRRRGSAARVVALRAIPPL